MNKFLVATIVITASLVAVGCGGKAESPKEVYLSHIKHVKAAEYKEACDLMTDKAQKQLVKETEDFNEEDDKKLNCEKAWGETIGFLTVFVGKDAIKDLKITVTKVDEKGDKATVHYTSELDGEKDKTTAILVKKDGKWLIDKDDQ